MKWIIQRLAQPSSMAGIAVLFQMLDQLLYGGASFSLDVVSLVGAVGAMVKSEGGNKTTSGG